MATDLPNQSSAVASKAVSLVSDTIVLSANTTPLLNIDGDDKHQAICVGYGWWDCDSGGGTEIENTPLPGMQVCEMCGPYTWTNNLDEPREDVGEFEYSIASGYGCCGDDIDEYWWGGQCHSNEEPVLGKEPLKVEFSPEIPTNFLFGLGLFFSNFFKKFIK